MRIKILKLIKLVCILFAIILTIIYSYNTIYGSYLQTENVEKFIVNVSEIEELFDLNLLNKILKFNEKLTVKNSDKFAELNDDNLVIVVQVHNRLGYLKNLIYSLSKTELINETLIIFSHDFYDKNINNLIFNITFAKVILSLL